jgi:DNA-binding MarR family transcriptional regulator
MRAVPSETQSEMSVARRSPRSLATVQEVARIREALNKPGRTEGVRKIAARLGVDPSTVQRISRPFEGGGISAA